MFNNDIKAEYQYYDAETEPTSIFVLFFPKVGIKLNSRINFDEKDKDIYRIRFVKEET